MSHSKYLLIYLEPVQFTVKRMSEAAPLVLRPTIDTAENVEVNVDPYPASLKAVVEQTGPVENIPETKLIV
jgi:hypothetical protein